MCVQLIFEIQPNIIQTIKRLIYLSQTISIHEGQLPKIGSNSIDDIFKIGRSSNKPFKNKIHG